MKIFTRLFVTLVIFLAIDCQAYTYNPQVEPEVWQKLEPYFLPEYHPIKEILDKTFEKQRACADLKALKKSHFRIDFDGEFGTCVVCRHKKTPGYIYKLYTDSGVQHPGWPEWLNRIEGAEYIRASIEQHGYGDWFKVPMKWIYPLPLKPTPADPYHAQYFILVEEDMSLHKESKNKKVWKSEIITPEILDALWILLHEIGLCDCVYISNIPFSQDGKISFIDTEMHHCWPIRMDRLAPFLGKEMQTYLKHLIIQGGPK